MEIGRLTRVLYRADVCLLETAVQGVYRRPCQFCRKFPWSRPESLVQRGRNPWSQQQSLGHRDIGEQGTVEFRSWVAGGRFELPAKGL